MGTTETVLFEVDDRTGVAVLTLNRPRRFNAFNREMIGAWRQALERVESESGIRALVVTGSGKAFCAGGDVDELDSFLTMS